MQSETDDLSEQSHIECPNCNGRLREGRADGEFICDRCARHLDADEVADEDENELMTDGGEELANATCHCGWPADWHKDEELCEVHAAEAWLNEGGMDEFR